MSDLIRRAREFAVRAHDAIDHRRKYSDEPYWVHPEAVARMVEEAGGDEAMVAAAWLHDVVEDTPCTLEQILTQFGERVAELVENLTDVSSPDDGNRARRKAIDRAHSACAHPDAMTIKLADLIHNTESIVRHDPGFARIYLREKALLLEVLTDGDTRLYERAQRQLREAQALLEGMRDRAPHKGPDAS